MKAGESTIHFRSSRQTFQEVMGIFPACYAAAGAFFRGLTAKSSASASTRDLRGYPARYAGINRISPETVSLVLLKFEDLESTRAYPDRTADFKAILWMDILQGKRDGHYYPVKQRS